MQYTTYYNMTKAEGSDIVNPLTQIFPNFDIIDGAMENNKNASVGTATEVKTGTVHAITRNNTNNPVFRFTASAAWTENDTMTVDATPVTVHTPDGASLVDNAYVIGSDVLAILNGNSLTVFVTAASSNQSVSVTSDGSMSYSQIFDSLYALADMSKIGRNSAVTVQTATDLYTFRNVFDSMGNYYFSLSFVLTQKVFLFQCQLKSSGSKYVNILDGNYQDITYNIPAAGEVYTLYY